MVELSYWEKRRAQMMYEEMNTAEAIADEIAKVYIDNSNYLQELLKKYYSKFRKNVMITDASVKSMLKHISPKRYTDILNYAKAQGLNDIVDWLSEPGQAQKFERVLEISNNFDTMKENLVNAANAGTTKAITEVAASSYNQSMYLIQKQVGLGFSFSQPDQKLFDKLINSTWSGENYSKRIWNNTEELASTMKSEIIQGFVSGKTQKEMCEVIDKNFAGSAMETRRLVRTECCFAANETERESYVECGIDMYIFVATLDLRTSNICAALDGKRFPVKDGVAGKNMPPMHPWCRSTTICDIDDAALSLMQRRARNPLTGKNELVPADMTYPEWHKKYVESNADAIAKQEIVNAEPADKKQFEHFKLIYSKDNMFPTTFEDFQKLKYSKPDEWQRFIDNKQKVINSMDYKDMNHLKQKLGDREARIWYNEHDKSIPSLIDQTKPIEDKARQAFDLRNKYRNQTRELMSNQKKRHYLDEHYPTIEFEDKVKEKMLKKQMSREQAIKDIYETAAKTNSEVNASFGMR